MKLGKKPATYSNQDLRFGDFQVSKVVPKVFGHGNTFKDWGMLGNDRYGDCVWAGAGHETMLLANLAAGGQTGVEAVKFTDEGVLSDYAAVTGFNPQTGEHDEGTEVRQAMSYRRKTGIIDASGNRHKIAAFVSLEVGNLKQLEEATWIFEAVGIGFEFPSSAMDQFNEGKMWSIVPGAEIEGGHYVPIVGKPATGDLTCITWGKRQVLTEAFYKKYTDEAWAFITQDELTKRSEDKDNWGGFDWKELQEALKAL